jgi:hypothetical protein
MKQFFPLFVILGLILLTTSCHKENSVLAVDPIKTDFLNNLTPLVAKYGAVDVSSISSIEKNSGKLKVTIGTVLGSAIIQKYIMISDDRRLGSSQRILYYMESNLPLASTATEKEHFTGYLKLLNFNGAEVLNYKIQDGVKTFSSNSLNYKASTDTTHWGCVTGCVNTTMNDMSWGTYLLCVAALPECAASVFLGCEIDCTLP